MQQEQLSTFDAGPLSSRLRGFRQWLIDAGRLEGVVRARVHGAGHFGYWLKAHGFELATLDDAVLAKFEAHLLTCGCANSRPGKHDHTKRAARQMVRYLEEQGLIAGITPPKPDTPPPPILLAFFSWMKRHRGVTDTTLRGYEYPVRGLLDVANDEPITIGVVRRFLLDRAERTSPTHARNAVSPIRMFVRFLVMEGKCSQAVLDAVPKIAHWQLSSLPRYLEPDAVERLLTTPSPPRVKLRNRAVLLLLSRLGLRAGDVATLRIDDVDWRQGRVMVTGKSMRQAWLPLCQELGDAMLAYMRCERPRSSAPEMFLTARRPIKPLTSGAVSAIVREGFKRAGLPPHGSHALRHTAATDLLREGLPLEAIGVVLRHQNTETTALYAKVDFASLRRVVQPWPGA